MDVRHKNASESKVCQRKTAALNFIEAVYKWSECTHCITAHC